jgi:arginase
MNAITDQTRVAILGLPFDANSSFMRGPAEAPAIIRQSFLSDSWNLWAENGAHVGAPNLIYDAGDLDRGIQEPSAEVERRVAPLLARGLAPICLGGDHSITFPVVQAFHTAFPDLALLHFDAHADIYDEFQGNRYSHGCPIARIMDKRLVTRLVQVGLRTITGEHREQICRFGLEVIEMKDWPAELVLEFEQPLYISVDLDVLDPAFAPGVSHHEPGGCSTRQLLQVIQSLKARVVGADIVEFNPRRDIAGITAMTGAKMLKELAAKMAASA